MKPQTVQRIVSGFAVMVMLAACAAGGPGASTSPTAVAGATSSTAASLAAAATSTTASSAATALQCSAPATVTISETEGPYYKAGAPENSNLVTDAMAGTRLTLTGYVVDTSCNPLTGVKVETWQADSSGTYDNSGYTLRGWVTTDANGMFTIYTIVPGEYPGRTEHVHVKVTPAGGSTLTTQLFFPGVQQNDADGIYDASLLLDITQTSTGLVGTYTFVVAGT